MSNCICGLCGHVCLIVALILLVDLSVAAPPNRSNAEENSVNSAPENPDENAESAVVYNFPYTKYLQAVMTVLDKDPKFQELIYSMKPEDFQAGKIADKMEVFDPNVLIELTKIKREELIRISNEKSTYDHLGTLDQTFTNEDLRKLITKTINDINQATAERQQKFKNYQIAKDLEEKKKIANMSLEEQELYKKKKNQESQNADPSKMKVPGEKSQFEEVWEKRDHMNKEDFNPKTFFNLHDLDGDDYWNREEVEAIQQLELDKFYNNETNAQTRNEEMYQMTDYFLNKVDKNTDMKISLNEFLKYFQNYKMQSNTGSDWKPIKNNI